MIYSHRFGMLALRPTLPSSAAAEEPARHEAPVTAVTQEADHPRRRKDEAA